MKRRKKTTNLNGTQAQHAEAQDVYLAQVKRAIPTIHRELRLESCPRAAKVLLSAAASWGAYNAEKEWTEKSAAGENATSNEYFAARGEYFKNCQDDGGLHGARKGRKRR